jgi:hypothetical protein
LPPFSLSTTTRLGRLRERYSPTTGLHGITRSNTGWMGTRSKCSLSTSIVESLEPSLTTTTSSEG